MLGIAEDGEERMHRMVTIHAMYLDGTVHVVLKERISSPVPHNKKTICERVPVTKLFSLHQTNRQPGDNVLVAGFKCAADCEDELPCSRRHQEEISYMLCKLKRKTGDLPQEMATTDDSGLQTIQHWVNAVVAHADVQYKQLEHLESRARSYAWKYRGCACSCGAEGPDSVLGVFSRVDISPDGYPRLPEPDLTPSRHRQHACLPGCLQPSSKMQWNSISWKVREHHHVKCPNGWCPKPALLPHPLFAKKPMKDRIFYQELSVPVTAVDADLPSTVSLCTCRCDCGFI